MGSQKPTDMSDTQAQLQEIKEKKQAAEAAAQEANQEAGAEDKKEEKTSTLSVKSKHHRGKKYRAVRAKVDKTRAYTLLNAVDLVKRLSYTSFPGTISAHLVLKDTGESKEIEFPHKTGRSLKVEIATEDTLKKIEDGNIDFDMLVATPQFMPKITKYAPILGPQGLMPNPKNGTLTPNPEQKKKELEAGKMTIKTERKAPLIHVPVGKTDMDTQKIVENVQVLIKAFKKKLKKLSIAATMSPGVKVEIEEE